METVNFRDATAEQQRQYLWGETKPYCVHCDTDCELATEAEVQQYKAYIDPNYQMKFIWVPTCNCFEEHEEWMSEKGR